MFYWRKGQEIGQFDNNSKVERGLRNKIVSNKRWMLCEWKDNILRIILGVSIFDRTKKPRHLVLNENE